MVDAQNHLGFIQSTKDLRSWVFIPKYYNPEISVLLDKIQTTHELVTLGDLVEEGMVTYSPGNEIGKMAYGTGSIPFVRTSDISNWEIKADPKQGVNEQIYQDYAKRQDIKAGDIFLVRDGTYLIGQSCMVTELDLPCLYQSHILKFRVTNESKIDKYLLFAALNSPIIQLQIKARQFTADIIDTLGNRFLELALPIPKDKGAQKALIEITKKIIEERSVLRERIKTIPLEAEEKSIQEELENISVDKERNKGFLINNKRLRNQIFMPKYYNPKLEEDIKALSSTHDLIPLSSLIENQVLSWETGIEVGKMAYGTGSIPFVRTSDISNWELKRDPKQAVGEHIYSQYHQDVKSGDVFVVRDGTYLVGNSCMVTKYDEKLLYCGGLYKFRVNKEHELDPYLFLALLNTPIVRRQMRSKQFTRDIIDTLGKRIFEVILPVPKNKKIKEEITSETRRIVDGRASLKNKITEALA